MRTSEVLRIRGLRRPRRGSGRSQDPLQMLELSLETVIRNDKVHNIFGFSRLCTRNSVRGFVRPSVHPSVCRSVGGHESKRAKTRISAPAHPSATGMGRVSGLV